MRGSVQRTGRIAHQEVVWPSYVGEGAAYEESTDSNDVGGSGVPGLGL